MFRTRLIPFLIALTAGFYDAQSIDLSKINLSYQYNTHADISIAHRVVAVEDSLSIYYRVKADTINDWTQVFLLQDNYNSVKHDTLRVYHLDTLGVFDEAKYFKLTIAKGEKSLLLITWFDMNRGVFRLEDVRVNSPIGFPSFYPVDESGLPILENYIAGDGIGMSAGVYHAYSYSDNFGPADPAMGRMKTIAPSLEIDSSFTFKQKIDHASTYSFYLIQDDTLAQTAITLLSVPDYYPKLRRVEELVPPLTYITTESEINTLTNKMSRNVFENFWVNTYGSRFRAKTAIRNFYDNIESVNSLFTDYKQGWKTDRGVIYLIFGPPDRVYRSESTEVWQYITGAEFEFIRISTLFTPSMYTLKRDRSYEQTWYNRVGELRKGM